MPPLQIALHEIVKSFNGIPVLKGIDLELAGGGVHALVGENGAGKSTMAAILAGSLRPDSGSVVVDGSGVTFRNPLEARRHGITLVSQELTLVPLRSVAENVLCGNWPTRGPGLISRRAMLRQFAEVSEKCGLHVPPHALVGTLNQAHQEYVEILRAVASGARMLILDEPTTAMTQDQAERIMALTRALADDGRCVVLITHTLDDVIQHCDTATVLRDGEIVRTSPVASLTKSRLIQDMIGRPLDEQIPPLPPMPLDERPVLQARDIRRSSAVRGVSFEVSPGEILGIAGLVGSGRSELARCVVGADRMTSGTVLIDGVPQRIPSVRDAQRLGIVMIPENRKQQGLHLDHTVERNITLPYLKRLSRFGFMRRRRSASEARRGIATVASTARPSSPVRSLSGGNQQRILFAKWIADQPRVLIADEPTRGVDVAGKRAIYELIVSLAQQGTAIILISSELPEVIGLSHRVLVMRHGAIAADLTGDLVTEAAITRAAFGVADATATEAA